MTYQSGSLGKIQAGDINSFLSTSSPNLNGLWSTGSGNSGYGQTAVATVAAADKIKATTWNNLIDHITKMAAHQGTSILSMTNTLAPTLPATSARIRIIADNVNTRITNNLSSINTNRLNSAATPRSTSSTTVTHSTTWSNALTATFTVSFASDNAARYFFNAGGQIGIQASHPNSANINRLLSEICSNIGTIWMSSPVSGTASIDGGTYHGIEQLGSSGTGSSVSINTNYGFYNWTTSSTAIITQYGSYSYPGSSGANYNTSTFGRISVQYNGTGSITITFLLDEVPNGAIAAANTQVTLIFKPPSTTYLSNSWGSISAGTITIGSSISAS